MIRNYRNKALQLFATSGDGSKLPVQNEDKIRILLARLDASVKPDDMLLPGFGFHGLQGKPKRYAVKVNKNFRITFGWSEEDAIDVDIEDYH
ncbi:type II toxin-antitoxin system RelE/ParE family toxin [Rhizorhabdus histidinilytica]|uniref:Plasmid maintenance system killer n=1 Tax=Rhizorhabdus wittichii (strain DSM 6014 / CCUG 31198 / JCM 15750 / NBRC 105917 / EY 4224 / RW1) TaxID=392499 RepID=A0A9J9HBS9_RHIWR|nr:type II toxin-antitoxin system RelE/ParE family toxin [Sphingomonas sp. Y57]ABQ68542.1 plasmid maintenance system killer [Rhizorhabdus wittichii RW1]